MDLTIRQLRAVLAVADAASFTDAAKRMHVAQSSLSRSVADVERLVGGRLFERTPRSVELTPLGVDFVRVASLALEGHETGMRHIGGLLDGSHGSIRLATLPSLAATLLPPIVAGFRQRFPAVDVRIVDALLDEVLDHVRTGDVDLAITVIEKDHRGTTFQDLATDRFFCVFPKGHRFAAAERVSWPELEGEDFIDFGTSSSVRRHVDRALDQAAVTRRSVTQARNVAAVGGLVAAGLGVSAVPALVLPLLQFAELSHRPLVEPVLQRRIGIVTDPGRPQTPAARGFLESCLRLAQEQPPLPDGVEWTTSRS